jgi:aspartate-semialdehyde dehydrogenase
VFIHKALIMQRTYSVAVIGASGLVGAQIVSLLEERGFPVKKLQVFRSESDDAESIEFKGETIAYELLCPPSLAGVDIAFFCATPEVSAQYAPEIGKLNGGLAIDLSRAFRHDPSMPLVLPELNTKEIEWAFKGGKRRMIMLPSAVSTAVSIAVAPLVKDNKPERVLVTSYQSASGAGKRGLDELHQQIVSILNARAVEEKVFSPQAAFNVLPLVPPGSSVDHEGFSTQESLISAEVKRLLHVPGMTVSATAAFVPVFIGDAVAVHIDFSADVDLEKARLALRQAPSVLLTEELEEKVSPMPITAAGEDSILVGRLRKSGPRSLWLWLSYDNVRKGAALNAVQLAEICIRDHQGAFEDDAKRPNTHESMIKH